MVRINKANLINFNDSITKAQAKIGKKKESIIVIKDNKYYGILDTRHTIEHIVKDPSNTPCGRITQKAPTIFEENTDILEISNAFFSVRFQNLAVTTKKGKVVGSLSRFDVLTELLREKDIPKKRVVEIMSSPIITINKNALSNEATTKMRKYGVRRLAVVDDNKKLIGLLSAYDIGLQLIKPAERLPKLKHEKINPWEQPISPFIKSKIEMITPEKTLTEAIKKMIDKKVPSLIVCLNGEPVGLVSTKDIFETMINSKERELRINISGLDRYDKPFAKEIIHEGEKLLDKLTKHNKHIGKLALHIKKYGNRYTVMARLEIENKVINAVGNGWDLPSSVSEALINIKTIIGKEKSLPF
ncbi:CBS domain-containing protein [Candidatus Micrarchaeota archaeon]|nr:CBS domain-containing protein [Candidatus Micrarchaeota archaeon]